MRQTIALLPLFSLLLAVATTAFVPLQYSSKSQAASKCFTSSTTCLNSVIKGEDVDAEIVDPGLGGVRLAEESAIKIVGDVKHKPGSADPKPMDLLRYTQVKEISEADVNKAGIKIVTVGLGKELYKDPGTGTTKEVSYAPLDAVRDATMGLGSTQDVETVVINFLGGNNLQMREVLDATQQMVINLDVKTSTKINFNSVSHKMFPLEQVTITVVGVPKKGENSEGDKLRGADKSLSEGEVYFRDGKYYTLVEEDITNEIE